MLEGEEKRELVWDAKAARDLGILSPYLLQRTKNAKVAEKGNLAEPVFKPSRDGQFAERVPIDLAAAVNLSDLLSEIVSSS